MSEWRRSVGDEGAPSPRTSTGHRNRAICSAPSTHWPPTLPDNKPIFVEQMGLVLAAVLGRRVERPDCACSALNAILVGLLGTVLLSLVLLAVGIVDTSVLSAIGVGVLLFLALALTASACYVHCANNCA